MVCVVVLQDWWPVVRNFLNDKLLSEDSFTEEAFCGEFTINILASMFQLTWKWCHVLLILNDLLRICYLLKEAVVDSLNALAAMTLKSSVLLEFPSGFCRGEDIQECKSRWVNDGFPTLMKTDLYHCWWIKSFYPTADSWSWLAPVIFLPSSSSQTQLVVTLKIQHYTVTFFRGCFIWTENNLVCIHWKCVLESRCHPWGCWGLFQVLPL